MEEKIEEKRDVINKLMRSNYYPNYEQIILLSQELDQLILQHTKKQMKKRKSKV